MTRSSSHIFPHDIQLMFMCGPKLSVVQRAAAASSACREVSLPSIYPIKSGGSAWVSSFFPDRRLRFQSQPSFRLLPRILVILFLPGSDPFFVLIQGKLNFTHMAGSVMRMGSICLLTGNGRSSLPKVGWCSTSQPQKQEGKSTHKNLNSMYMCKSATGVGRCKWPLVVWIRRFPKERMAGFLAMDYHMVARRALQRSFVITVSSEEKTMQLSEEYTDISNGASSDFSSNYFGPPVDKTELETVRLNNIRANLVRKLSEANQHNRHVKRQLQDKEQALNKYKNELAVMELELQALVTLAEEVARGGIRDGSRKVNGRYIHSHLVLRLEVLHEKLLEQIKGVDAMQFREVPLVFYGMAEDVKVMGSFDGWIHGEQMSPESSASFTKFSTIIKLHPGRYEIKFLVDGEWQLSPELQIVGEGPLANNLLVVE